MHHAGWRERNISRVEVFRLVTDLNNAAALQKQVQLVLPFVRVKRVFLSGLERVQAGEE